MCRSCLLLFIVLPVVTSGCRTTQNSDAPNRAAYQLFDSHVRPILEENCLRCHNGTTPGQLNLSNRATAFMPDASGRSYIAPGKPDESLLIEAVTRDGLHQRLMPRLPVSLTDMEIGTLREWIEAGAPWPVGKSGNLN